MSRLVTQDPNTQLYYTDLGGQIQLREIIIGHRCAWTAETVRKLIGGVALPVRICKARPAFGKFEMVEQKNFKPVTVRATKQRP